MKVNFKYPNGKERMMSEREAKILSRLGRGTYLTRDMVADNLSVDHGDGYAPVGPIESFEPDYLDSMTAEQLHELAKRRDIKVHHKAGADKVRAALRSAE